MSNDVYLVSTLTADQLYTAYAESKNDLPRIEHQVLVRGGSNVADRRLVTPNGVVTKVTGDEYELLKQNHVFQLHVDNGFITKLNSKPSEPETVAADMNTRSDDAPLVEADYDGTADPKPVVQTLEEKEAAEERNVGGVQRTNAPSRKA